MSFFARTPFFKYYCAYRIVILTIFKEIKQYMLSKTPTVAQGKHLRILNEHYSLADCITLWGNSASIALLDPACKIFSRPTIPGIIGYRLESKNIVVFGDPLCPPEHVADLTTAFHAEFANKVNNIIYVAASEAFTNWSLQGLCKAAISFGHEVIIDPSNDPRIGSGEKAALLRRKCNQAARQGVQIYEYTEYNAELEKAIEAVGQSWIKNRKGPQIYLQHVAIFADREHKRYFYAEQNGAIIGVLILNAIGIPKGWVLSFSMVPGDAPKGTSELILVNAFAVLGKQGCSFFSIGSVPSSELSRIEGLGYVTTWFARHAYAVSKKIFHLDEERQRYWKKFRPKKEATYLVFCKPKIGIGGVVGIMRALNASV